MIMEKVWAKLHGSYSKIMAGQSYEVYRDLLGAPSFYHKTNEDYIWEKVYSGYQNEFIMSATSYPNDMDLVNLENTGIIALQSYSILRIAIVPDSNGSQVRLIQLRNPQAKFEWKGEWSDGSRGGPTNPSRSSTTKHRHSKANT